MSVESVTPIELLSGTQKPDWFEYPKEFLWVHQTGIQKFRPWRILGEPHISGMMMGLKKRYSHRELVPFACRLDCDDVACWERKSMPRVVIIHNLASTGWESRQTYDSFWEWFRSAINDFIEFD